MADNMMRERGNSANLKKAAAYLNKSEEIMRRMFEVEDDQPLPDNIYVALLYQYKGKFAASSLDREECLKIYRTSEEIYLRTNNGEEFLIM
jgi:hypothetical protein